MKKSIGSIDWDYQPDPQLSHWVLPQLAAHIGSMWPLVKGVDGKVSPTMTLKGWAALAEGGSLTLDRAIISKTRLKVLLRYLTQNPRGEVLGSLKQVGDGVRWSAPVPLIPSFFKEFREVPYSLWDWSDTNLHLMLDQDLVELVQVNRDVLVWELDDLIQFRVGALEIKTGKHAGTVRKPETCSQVYGVTDPQFRGLPRLVKLMLTQLWCYHPTVRHKFMICSLDDFDAMPPPLVEGEVVKPPEGFKTTKTTLEDLI